MTESDGRTEKESIHKASVVFTRQLTLPANLTRDSFPLDGTQSSLLLENRDSHTIRSDRNNSPLLRMTYPASRWGGAANWSRSNCARFLNWQEATMTVVAGCYHRCSSVLPPFHLPPPGRRWNGGRTEEQRRSQRGTTPQGGGMARGGLDSRRFQRVGRRAP